jgi:hypothetical protein
MIRTPQSELDMMAADYRKGASVKEISVMYFMSESSVRRRLKRASVKMRPARVPWIGGKQQR